MTSEKQLLLAEAEAIVKENKRRYKLLRAEYNPVTGEDAPGERVKITISDFATPTIWIPVDMMKVKLIRLLVKYGSIQALLDNHPFKKPQTFRSIERQIRRIWHKYDFIYWAYMMIHIDDKEGKGDIRFKLNYAQIKVFEVCERLRKAGLPINLIICKARQWGGSTFCFFYQTWIALKWKPSHKFSICAQTNGVADSIKDMLSHALEEYKAWDLGLPDDETLKLVPKPKGNEYTIKTSQGKQVRENKIRIGSIIAPDNLRGLPGSGAHYSEVGVWPDTPGRRPDDLIKSIGGGILPLPYSMQVIESTAKGTGTPFHQRWLAAKNGLSSYTAVFIPWYYIPHDTLPVKDEIEFALWLLENKDNPNPPAGYKDPGRYYWYLWESGATLQGINWYRIKRKEFEDFADMASEAPSNDIEAFQHSGSKVFSLYDIHEIRKGCEAPKFKGDLISRTPKGTGSMEDIKFISNENGNLWVWVMPDYSRISDRYLVSVDVGGRSKTADWSVIRVFDRMPMMYGGKPVLVAQKRYHTDFDLLAYDAVRIAKWYNNALLVIESNTLETKDQERDVDGDMSQYILNEIGGLYDNLYARHSTPEDIAEKKPTKWGYHTNVQTKPMLIANLIECVREKLWVEKDEYCCDELSIYEKNAKGQYAAAVGKGNHDDVLMATAIALFICYKEMDMPKWIEESTYSAKKPLKDNSAAVI